MQPWKFEYRNTYRCKADGETLNVFGNRLHYNVWCQHEMVVFRWGMCKGRCWEKMREFSWRCDYKAHLTPAWMPSLQRIMMLLSHGLNCLFLQWKWMLEMEAPIGVGRVGWHSLPGWSHSMKGFKGPCTCGKSVPYSAPPFPALVKSALISGV